MNGTLYLDRRTWIHRLDGRTKFLSILFLFGLTLLFSDPRYLLMVGILVLFGVMVSQSMINVKRSWILLLLLFLYSTFLWPFFVDGETPLVQLGSFRVTTEALAFGLGMGIRLNLMVVAGLLLLSTTTVEDFARSLQRLGLPCSIGFAISLAFRWVPTLLGASGTVVQAQRSRGLELSTGPLRVRIRRYSALLVPLIGHALRQTTLLAMALESKGFAPGQVDKRNTPQPLGRVDYVVLIFLGLVLGVGLWLRLKGFGVLQVRF